MACTETGLKMCVFSYTLTLKPLKIKDKIIELKSIDIQMRL